MKMRFLRPAPASPAKNDGMAAISSLIGGFVVWGGVGWLLDRWLETRFLTPIGVIAGMALGIYAVVARANAASAPAETRPTDPKPGPPPASPRRETECP